MRFDGKIKSWDDDRGFGFIEPKQGGQEIFVHIKTFPAGTGRPVVGLALSFEVEIGPQGKKRAKAVQFVRTSRKYRAPSSESPAPWTMAKILIFPIFGLVFFYIASRWPVKPIVPIAYFVASIITFMAYALDKSAAIQSRWRISESTLHMLSLSCGWPGALAAQQLLRHKTLKAEFMLVYWLTTILNIAAFVFYHSPIAASLLS